MKIKIIAILSVILILAMSVSVYADNPIPYPPNDAYEYWAVFYRERDGIQLLTSEEQIKVRKSTKQEDRIFIKATGRYRLYLYNNGNWELISEGTTMEKVMETIYASNHDIAYYDGSGFFFVPPKVPILSPVMKKVDFGTILRNFSVGLIPIVGLLILVIAFRKAWGFLRSQLTR